MLAAGAVNSALLRAAGAGCSAAASLQRLRLRLDAPAECDTGADSGSSPGTDAASSLPGAQPLACGTDSNGGLLCVSQLGACTGAEDSS